MRNLSFALTTAQMRARTKTVTRRCGTYWTSVLKPGDLVCAVEKSQGIKKGGLVRLGVIRIVCVRVEPLDKLIGWDAPREYGCEEVVREGFPEMTPLAFLAMFMSHMKCPQAQIVTRIEFEHVSTGGGS